VRFSRRLGAEKSHKFVVTFLTDLPPHSRR
jgi:hypothetical protein